MKKFLLASLLAVGGIVLIGCGGIFWLNHQWTHPVNLIARDAVTIIISKGSSLDKIASNLKANGLIDQTDLFKLMAVVKGKSVRLQAGEYRFQLPISMERIVDQLVKGQVYDRYLTIPEGLTSTDIKALIEQAPAFTGKIGIDIKEGSLLPETYQYHYGDSREALIKQMRDAQTRLLDELWQERPETEYLLTRQEAVILASLIEAETNQDDERALISAVFHNRLNRNMRLQSDPTVIYAIKNQGLPFDRALTRKDLTIDSPYNSYKNKGLPPTAINHPGAASLHAALNPAASDMLYFVATGTGGHYFAKDYKTHQRNVAQYRNSLKTRANPLD